MGVTMEQKLSVIIPIYNVEPYLRQCLDSVVNQTYRDLEIILVDDGSPDNCGAICDEYAARDDRVIVIHKKNGGLSEARNDGIRRATGEWIAFVDSDDWCDPDYYERLLKWPVAHDVDIICASGHYMEIPPEKTEQRHCFSDAFILCSGEGRHILMDRVLVVKGTALKGNAPFGYPWDKLYRRGFLVKARLFFDGSLRVCEDSLFNYQAMSKAEKVVGRICAGYHYRVNMDSITKAYDTKRPEKNYQYVSRLCKYAEDQGIDDSMKKALNAHVIACIASSLKKYYFHPDNKLPGDEIAKEIKEMTNRPLYHEALCNADNKYLSPKLVMLKYLLRYNAGGGVTQEPLYGKTGSSLIYQRHAALL